MKIVEKKDFSTWRLAHTCSTCESKLEVSPEDVYGRYQESQGDARDGYSCGGWSFVALCPVCESVLCLASSTMSRAMLHEIQTKRQMKKQC